MSMPTDIRGWLGWALDTLDAEVPRHYLDHRLAARAALSASQPESIAARDPVADRYERSIIEAQSETAWLVERGQPERQVPTVWWSSRDADWTTDANRATRYPSRAVCEAFIEEASPIPSHRPRFGRAVEHGWVG